MSWIVAILLNILGGILAGLALWGIELLIKFYRTQHPFRKFFGVDDEYNIIYCLYNAPMCPHSDPSCKLVFRKKPRQSAGSQAHPGINLQEVTSVAGAKGVGFLVEAFSRNLKKSPKIVADVDPIIETRRDISFISLGGGTNHKTCDLLDNPSNIFVNLVAEPLSVIIKSTNKELAKNGNAGTGKDFGFIVKIHPDNNYERTWISCFGFGIVGTIGAAHYIANKWKQIRKYVNYQPFALMIQSQAGSEDSNIPIHLIVKRTGTIRERLRVYKAKKAGLEITLI
jgi:hypothetical protein